MLDSIVPIEHADTDAKSTTDITEPVAPPTNPYLRTSDPTEAALEAQEAHKYLLAKSYFDTRDYDRCAAVFLPPTTPPIPLSVTSPNAKPKQVRSTPLKGKNKASPFQSSKSHSQVPRNLCPKLSQKYLFLALYAKCLAGEKRKDEEREMVLGPADVGIAVNRELPDLARGLEGWLAERSANGLDEMGQVWLEYLYGVILLKGRNEEAAKTWLIRSVHQNPFHWGAWQELNDLLGSIEDVRIRITPPGNPLISETLTSFAVETNERSSAGASHDPHILCLLQPRALPSYRCYIRDFG
jgi:anaphase-promoting complex subunit 8